MSIENRIADVYDAACAYVRARLANDGAEPADVMASIAEVDRTWADLLVAFDATPVLDR